MFNTITSGNYVLNGSWNTSAVGSGIAGNATVASSIYTSGVTYTSGTSSNTANIPGNIFYPQVVPHKKCRDCNHSHLNDTCVEFKEWGAVTFVKCQCKEYAPKDNLEYLEHLYDKKQKKEKVSSL